MKARKLFHYKAYRNTLLVEMVIWKLPVSTAVRPHGLKYRLYCGDDERCLVRYDNESAKGDHRHYGDDEEPYHFESLNKLLADFRDDCSRLAGWRWKDEPHRD